MAKIAFIGLGNMGGPMAANPVKAQHQVDGLRPVDAAAVDAAVDKGAHKAASAAEAVKGAEIVVTMLPAGKHVREVYEKDVLPNVAKGTLLIDCSTIDVDSARACRGSWPQRRGLEMVDAPVSGGVGGADGRHAHLHGRRQRCRLRQARGRSWRRWARTSCTPAPSATGQAAKICNNMILGISHDRASAKASCSASAWASMRRSCSMSCRPSSGQCWSLTNYLPGAGPGADLARQPRLPGGLHRGR